MKRRITRRDRLRYALDRVLARGPVALVAGLAVASALLIVLASVVTRLATGGEMSLARIFWNILFQALTPNPVEPDAGPWPFLFSMLVVTVGSLLMVSILIGILTTGIGDRLRALRRGRSRVLERGHTVILGWDEHIFTIISQFVVHHRRRRGCLVILGDKDKVDMEDEIRQRVGPTGRVRVICRSGDPMSHEDLDLVNLNDSRAIVVLGPDDDDPDAAVIKTILAIVNNPHRRAKPYHIVAEIIEPDNVEAAELVGGTEVELVRVGQLTSYIIAQTCRRAGVSTVFMDLLDFQRSAIYFHEEAKLVGKSFGEALLAYDTSAVMGLRPKVGPPRLNPPADTVIEPGDKLIALSSGHQTIRLAGPRAAATVDDRLISRRAPVPREPERTLVLGWNWRATTVLQELDHYLVPGSVTTVAADVPGLEQLCAELRPQLHHHSLECICTATRSRKALEQLGVQTYDHVVVLAYSDALSPRKADARTLMTLLQLRDIADRTGRSFTIVSEMLDEHTRKLAEVTRADDFIVSGKLASLLLAQIADNRALHEVFIDLFRADGSEIYLKPACDYVKLHTELNFYTVVEAVKQRSEVALGYRLDGAANDPAKSYGVVLNPDKSKRVAFGEHDQLIVLAETE